MKLVSFMSRSTERQEEKTASRGKVGEKCHHRYHKVLVIIHHANARPRVAGPDPFPITPKLNLGLDPFLPSSPLLNLLNSSSPHRCAAPLRKGRPREDKERKEKKGREHLAKELTEAERLQLPPSRTRSLRNAES